MSSWLPPEANMHFELLVFLEGYIIYHQGGYPLTFAVRGGGMIPDRREIIGELFDTLSG